MILKNAEIITLYNAIREFNQSDFPVDFELTMTLFDNFDRLEEQVNIIDNRQMELSKRYFIVDNNGVPKQDEEGNIIPKNNDKNNFVRFNRANYKLSQSTVDIDLLMINVEYLKGLKISPRIVSGLKVILEK